MAAHRKYLKPAEIKFSFKIEELSKNKHSHMFDIASIIF